MKDGRNLAKSGTCDTETVGEPGRGDGCQHTMSVEATMWGGSYINCANYNNVCNVCATVSGSSKLVADGDRGACSQPVAISYTNRHYVLKIAMGGNHGDREIRAAAVSGLWGLALVINKPPMAYYTPEGVFENW